MLVAVNDFPGVVRAGDLEVAVSVSERRKSVRLTVERDASVTAVVPPRVSKADLVKMVEAKRSWLYGKLAEKRDLGEAPPDRDHVSGEGFLQDGQVNIHWAAVQLSPTLIDHVLVHEPAHVRRPDHGPEFWRIVERTMPGYEERRERLRRTENDLRLPEEGR
jgi:predicted metal-dependent hydrolase